MSHRNDISPAIQTIVASVPKQTVSARSYSFGVVGGIERRLR